MADTVSKLVELLKLYNNNSFIIILFIVSLIILWIVEKNKSIKTSLVYITIALTAIFICPLYVWMSLKLDDEVYYRSFWALPVGLLFSYACVKLVMCCKHWIIKIIVAAAAVGIIILNGKLVYTNSLHFKAVNKYHIPEVVITVADALKMEKYTPVAVLPDELLPFLRQYSCDIITPYGRNVMEASWGEKWGFNNELHEAMKEDVYDTELIAQLARKENCVYVVLSSIKEQLGSMEEQNYHLQEFAGGYYIYMDNYCYDILLEQELLDERQIIQ